MNRIRFSLAALATVTLLAACGGGTSDGQSPVDPANADVSVTSMDIAFEQTTLTASSGEAFTLSLVNEDSVPHNVSIYTDSSASEDLYIGEYVTDGTIVYEIPALEPGEYFFRCDLHPEMTGTLIVEG
ncbi:MAG: cupredoxin domain-containing protein [Chloroflexi bacterium]|nr:cupredoxin domain-containing protein [Chloroflexota bacterium]